MAEPTLIYCAAGSKRFSAIAVAVGMKYGARLPGTVSHSPLYFADQDWKKPDRAKYMDALAQHNPVIASVLDWEREDQLSEVLSWAEEAAQHVRQSVIIIPKVKGGINKLPRTIGGKQVRLGYSTPTKYGGTKVGLWEFKGWSVHCLGGSPSAQRYVHKAISCDSVDGNHLSLHAQNAQFFYTSRLRGARNEQFPNLRDLFFIKADAPYVAFELSCLAYTLWWQGVDGMTIAELQRERVRQLCGEEAITAQMERLF